VSGLFTGDRSLVTGHRSLVLNPAAAQKFLRHVDDRAALAADRRLRQSLCAGKRGGTDHECAAMHASSSLYPAFAAVCAMMLPPQPLALQKMV
jgi:hypothetical protein